MDGVDTAMRLIQRYGETIRITRTRGAATLTCTPVAFVQGFQPEELVGPLVSGDRSVRILDAEVLAAGMSPPVSGDVCVIDGKPARVKSVDTIRISGAIAQHAMIVGAS